MTPVPTEDDPLATLLVPFLVERTASLGVQAQQTPDPERTLAEVPDWGWLLGVLASSLGFGLGADRSERDGLALLARALDGALSPEELRLGSPLGPWPQLATSAADGWIATWAVGRSLLWAVRGAGARRGARAELAMRFESRHEDGAERLVLHACAGDIEGAPELASALARRAPAIVFRVVGERFELSLPAVWFAERQPC